MLVTVASNYTKFTELALPGTAYEHSSTVQKHSLEIC